MEEEFVKERNQYAFQNTTLEFSVRQIDIHVVPGEVSEFSLEFWTNGEENIQGRVYVNDIRINCLKETFSGRNIVLPFEYDATQLSTGDGKRGTIYIISNVGEYVIPYEVLLDGLYFKSSLGEIRNLFHFANLARSNVDEALKCFINPQFESILTGSSGSLVDTYRSLREEGCLDHTLEFAMEQFLIMARKKMPVELSFEKEKIEFLRTQIPQSFQVKIIRNTWGYSCLDVICHGDFLDVKTKRIETKDFKNDCYYLDIVIKSEQFAANRNVGIIELVCANQTVRLPIEIAADYAYKVRRMQERKDQNQIEYMIRLYLDYRTGIKTRKQCIVEATKGLEQVTSGEHLLKTLYHAHAKLLADQINEANWLLKNAKRQMETKEIPLDIYSYFLYLSAKSMGDYSPKAAYLLEEYYKKYPDQFMVYWSIMHLNQIQVKDSAITYRSMRRFWMNGCNSPLLYLEAALMNLNDPSLMSNIGSFEVRLIQFMDKQHLIDRVLLERIHLLSLQVKSYEPVLMNFMKKFPNPKENDMVKFMCLQHIKGNNKGEEAASWLRKGITLDLRITKLFEAYIYAIDFASSVQFPEEVVRYFAYDSSMNPKYLAYVFAIILKQESQLSSAYEDRIRNFALTQLDALKIDENLATLYRVVLRVENMTKQRQENLLKMLFTYQLTVEDKKLTKCIVRQEHLQDTMFYPIKNGQAIIKLDQSSVDLLFQDENKYLFCKDVCYQIKPLLGYERIFGLVQQLDLWDPHLFFYQLKLKGLDEIREKSEFLQCHAKYRYLLTCDEFTLEFRKKLSGDLLKCYAKFDMVKELLEFLNVAEPKDFQQKDWIEFVTLLKVNGLYQKAFDAICIYGFEQFDIKMLTRLSVFLIEENAGEYQKQLLIFIMYIFEKGKYTEEMITYLVRWFEGPAKQLRNIWKAAVAMEIKALNLAEKILYHLLLTGSYIAEREKIFEYYCINGGKKEIIDEYLVMCTKEYLEYDQAIEPVIFETLIQFLLQGEELSMSTKMAVLKYESSRVAYLFKDQLEMCKRLLAESLEQDIYFPYYQHFVDCYPALSLYAEKSYVEFYGEPGSLVTIHYLLDRPGDTESSYCKEEMKEIYPGYFLISFSVYWGERLQYYITHQEHGTEQYELSGVLERGENLEEIKQGRFQLLNDLALSIELQDYETAESVMDQYAMEQFYVDELLTMKS